MSFASKTNPWTSQPLTDAAKNAKYKKMLDLSADRVIMGRSAILAGWAVGAVGAVALGASIFGWVTILPLKTVDVRVIEVDKTTGAFSEPTRLKDAPLNFGKATDEHFLHQYISARESWSWERDKENDHIVRIMSSPSEQTRLNDEREKPTSNPHMLGKDAYAVLENFRYFPRAMDHGSETHRYEVKFDRTVWHRNATGATKDPTQPWTATIDFQWHPNYKMNPEDRDINLGGFLEISYSAKSDIPDLRRQ